MAQAIEGGRGSSGPAVSWFGRTGIARASTIGRRQAAVKKAHQVAGLPSPTDDVRARAVMAGIRRERGVRPVQKAPLITDLVIQMLEKIPSDTVAGLRDRALILLRFKRPPSVGAGWTRRR